MNNHHKHSLWSPNHYELISLLGGQASASNSNHQTPDKQPEELATTREQINALLLNQMKQFLPNVGPVCSIAEMTKWRQEQTLDYIENHPQEFLSFAIQAAKGSEEFSIHAQCDEKKLAQTLKHNVLPQSRFAWGTFIMWIISRGMDSVEHLMGIDSQHDQLARVTRLVGNTMMFAWNKKLQQNMETMTMELAQRTGREAILKYNLIKQEQGEENLVEKTRTNQEKEPALAYNSASRMSP